MNESARPRKPAVPHLLLVNGTRYDYADALTAAGYRVTTVDSMREALASRSRPDAVIVELMIPDGNLSHLAQAMKSGRRTKAMTVIALAGEGHEEIVAQAGATFCRHPCPPDQLVMFVEQTLALRQAVSVAGAPQRSSRPS